MADFSGVKPTYTDVSTWSGGTWAGAAGAIVSTPSDAGRFIPGLMSGKLLPPAQLAEMKKVEPALRRRGQRWVLACSMRATTARGSSTWMTRRA
jgi:hypothetical protein